MDRTPGEPKAQHAFCLNNMKQHFVEKGVKEVVFDSFPSVFCLISHLKMQ